MRLLAIDTVTEMCSVALMDGDEVIARQSLAPNQHSNLILSMVDEVLSDAQFSLSSLDLIVNDVGPGSFTGIRIGLGVTQGLAYGANIPVVGVDALSVLANDTSLKPYDTILAAIDARMGQLYWGRFKRENNTLKPQGELRLSHPEDINVGQEDVYGIGSGIDMYADKLGKQINLTGFSQKKFPLAVNALTIAAKQSKESWCLASELTPIYLRNDVAKVATKTL